MASAFRESIFGVQISTARNATRRALAPPAVSRWCRYWLVYAWEQCAEFRLAS